MRYLISAVIISIILMGCGKKQKDVDPKTGLTPENYDLMKAINDDFQDLSAAVALGVGTGSTDGPSEKVSVMAKMIRDGGCSEGTRGTVLDGEVVNAWSADYVMGAEASCPLQINRTWDYVVNPNREWSISHSIKINNSDFKNQAVVESFTLSNGQLTVKKTNGGSNYLVEGGMNITNFVVKGAGLLVASMSTDQQYTAGHVGGGTINFNISSRTGFRAKLVMTFRTGRATTYRINGYNVEQGVVDELFSSFGLEQIRDRSQKMLY